MSNKTDNKKSFDEEFDELFGDLFKNLPTREEMEARKKEEELKRKSVMETKRFFNAYARTLPGAEKIREDNPPVEIRSGINENGESYIKTITQEEKIEEFFKEFDEMFKAEGINIQDEGHHHK